MSALPWYGVPRDISPTLKLIAEYMAKPDYAGRLSVSVGHWPSEEAQRQFGTIYLKFDNVITTTTKILLMQYQCIITI